MAYEDREAARLPISCNTTLLLLNLALDVEGSPIFWKHRYYALHSKYRELSPLNHGIRTSDFLLL